jgi:hypothetical protein
MADAGSPKGVNMARQVSKKKPIGSARPIRNKRDFAAAQTVVKKTGRQTDGESVAETRLQSLIHAMDKFDGEEEDAEDALGDDGYGGPLRRWSDGSTDPDSE